MENRMVLNLSTGEISPLTFEGDRSLEICLYDRNNDEIPKALRLIKINGKGYDIDLLVDSDSIVRKLRFNPVSQSEESVAPVGAGGDSQEEQRQISYKAVAGATEATADDYERVLLRAASLAHIPIDLDEKMSPDARCIGLIVALNIEKENKIKGLPDLPGSSVAAIVPNWIIHPDVFLEIMEIIGKHADRISQMSVKIVEKYAMMVEAQKQSVIQ